MSKYRPESRRNLEDRVKDLSRKAKDRVKHVVNVKKDAKALADVAGKIKPTGTIEAGKEIKRALKDSGKYIRLKFELWRMELVKVTLKSRLMENGFNDRIKNSKSNYDRLTDTSKSINETTAARKRIDQGRRVTKEEMDMIKIAASAL